MHQIRCSDSCQFSEWRAFDDATVTRVTRESQVVDPDAYFLFYKRRDNDNASMGLFDRYRDMETDREN